ncbi:hypothetical protein ONA91_38800 [Micromonospora sp. DR5-3]|uniref:hypothetical protein n=1 Tax=unclassified Micromonospora TaxID=2617518 RepID=UPI0011D7873C|nr:MULTISPECIES: hypothetical protein [unclassified Micromonospora]MCW3820397.1 hypothetical protein [Micromonospora sp. DR5-3]TYC19435.1 hypothetical protein FXF52_36700 [Micromonospora sp. MP36]
MTPSRPRPGTARRHRLSLIACFTVPGGVAALTSLFAWSGWLAVISSVIALVVASQLVLTETVWKSASLTVKAVAIAAFVASVFWVIAMMFAPRLAVLDLRGQPVVATVVDHDASRYYGRGGKGEQHCYRLQRTDGSPIFGDICRDRDEFAVGETMTVLVDPSGLIAPETPSEVADARFWQIPGLVSLVAALVLCWVTGGLTPRVASGHLVRRRLPRPRRSRYRSKYEP